MTAIAIQAFLVGFSAANICWAIFFNRKLKQ